MGRLIKIRMNRLEYNRIIRNANIFISVFGNDLKANSLAKMERDGKDITDSKLVGQCEALYISACIRELMSNSQKYLR